jgi:phosphoribosylanthranilate isomerase
VSAMVKVKICGITNWPDAKAALDAGADALGFNFFPPSPRHITAADAREIVRRMPRRASAVGVFVDEPAARVKELARFAGLHFVQLHGDETPRTVRELHPEFLVIKAFQVRRGFRIARLAPFAEAAAFLMDGFRNGLRGGTGNTFDWRVAREAKRYGAILVAGGITPGNVAQAIAEAEPFGVDVSSGVEARPGKKDARKIRALMRAVEAAQRKVA